MRSWRSVALPFTQVAGDVQVWMELRKERTKATTSQPRGMIESELLSWGQDA